jgi:hypothetical protein
MAAAAEALAAAAGAPAAAPGSKQLLEAVGNESSRLIGSGAAVLDADADCIAHTLPPPSPLAAVADEPALLLFDAATQRRRVAFMSREPLLTPAECAAVLAEVDAHVASAHGGAWPSVRRSSVPTTDIAVEDVPALVPWLRALLASRIFPMLAVCYPLLAGGRRLEASALRVHDAFIVRYDAAFGSTSLPEHSDTSALSVSLSLNERGRDFDGGGLSLRCFEGGAGVSVGADEHGVLHAPEGCATAFMGPLRHGGASITRGVRVILVLFLYVENFAYGRLLRHVDAASEGEAGSDAASVAAATARQEAAVTRREAAATRGYVVYRETVQLMEALEGDSGEGGGEEDEAEAETEAEAEAEASGGRESCQGRA